MLLFLNIVGCKEKEEHQKMEITELYAIECLQKIPNIVQIKPVTEDNDPNGNLNKQGGYISQIYFSVDLIDQDEVYGETVIDKGTDAGGSIEIYRTIADAMKRDEYLSAFDGGFMSSGSHTVLDCCVIRTSNLLTASQQKELEKNIIFSLSGKAEQITKIAIETKQDNNTEESIIEYEFDKLILLPDMFAAGTLYPESCYGWCSYFDFNDEVISEYIIYKIDTEYTYYEYDDKVWVDFSFYCDPSYFKDRSKLTDFAFQVVAYDFDDVRLNSIVAHGGGNWGEKIKISATMELELSDVTNGVKIKLDDYRLSD